MNTYPAVLSVIRDQISRMFDVPPDSVTEETMAADIDGWDSLSHTILLLNIERALGRKLPIDDTTEARNVGELARICAAAAT